MKNLKNKLSKKGGFTLVEMLIVVAIIAILIAVSIPLIGNSLENARKATDDANERAAKAEGSIIFLAGGTVDGAGGSPFAAGKANGSFWYNNKDGKLQTAQPAAYGQSQTEGHVGQAVIVTIDATNGTVSTSWGNVSG